MGWRSEDVPPGGFRFPLVNEPDFDWHLAGGRRGTCTVDGEERDNVRYAGHFYTRRELEPNRRMKLAAAVKLGWLLGDRRRVRLVHRLPHTHSADPLGMELERHSRDSWIASIAPLDTLRARCILAIRPIGLLCVADANHNQGVCPMRVAKDDVEVRLEVPGAVIRQRTDFGDASGFGRISGEYFSLAAGVDTSPLFLGLKDDLCQCPHWGFVLRGTLTTTDSDGARETVHANDLFYWPPGHNVRVDADAEIVMFSPQAEHSEVIDHMVGKMNGG